MVRFHSFYPWHAHGDYGHLCSEEDRKMLPWLRELKWVPRGAQGCPGVPPRLWGGAAPALTPVFAPVCSKFDLYTKQGELPDVQQLRDYYQGLIDKYCPGQLCW